MSAMDFETFAAQLDIRVEVAPVFSEDKGPGYELRAQLRHNGKRQGVRCQWMATKAGALSHEQGARRVLAMWAWDLDRVADGTRAREEAEAAAREQAGIEEADRLLADKGPAA